MTVSFSGVSLLYEDEELLSWIEHNISLDDLFFVCQNLEPVFNYPDSPSKRLQTLYWPTGAGRYGWFFGLANEARKNTILANVESQKYGALTLSDGDVSVTTTMYLLPPRQLSVGPGTDLWLIPLVDQRFWWQFLSVQDVFLIPSIGIDDWTDLVDIVQAGSGLSITVDTINSAYLKPDPTTFNNLEDTAVSNMLDMIAASLGLRVVLTVGNVIRLMSWANSETIYTANLLGGTLAAGSTFDDSRSAIPESIDVSFPIELQHIPKIDGERYAINKTPTSFTAADVIPGTRHVIRSTAYADFTDGNSTADNETALNGLAAKIAVDYYAGLAHQYDMQWNGIKEWNPTAFDDSIIWSLGRQRSPEDGFGDRTAYTRVQSLPHNLLGAGNYSQDGDLTIYDDLIKKGRTDVEIISSGAVSIWEGGADTLINVTGHFNWMKLNPTDDVNSGKDVLLKYFRDEDKWVIIGRECNS